VRIVDLAESVAPGIPVRVIGIRPGEKLHEAMVPRDDSHLTLEFNDHYVISPTIRFADPVDYAVDELGDRGTPVAEGFEYNSGTNEHFLTVGDLHAMNGLVHA